jgi:hypothetical protein
MWRVLSYSSLAKTHFRILQEGARKRKEVWKRGENDSKGGPDHTQEKVDIDLECDQHTKGGKLRWRRS